MRLVIHALQREQVDRELTFSQSVFQFTCQFPPKGILIRNYFAAHPKSMQYTVPANPVLTAPNVPHERPPIASPAVGVGPLSAFSRDHELLSPMTVKTASLAAVPTGSPSSNSACSRTFKYGDIVLAKIRGYPAWPGMVSDCSYCVYFFAEKLLNTDYASGKCTA
jgi:hypothetical protein